LLEGVRLWLRAPLAPFTTIGTGGKADALVTVDAIESLVSVLALVESADIPWMCLGAGSNVLVSDRGYPGMIVKLGDSFHYVDELPSSSHVAEEAHLLVGAGAHLSRLAVAVAEAGLSGLEFSCGIPGSLGGGVAMNAGAHGSCLAFRVLELEVVSAEGRRVIPSSALSWGYRHCGLPPGSIVTACRLALTRGDRDAILMHHRALLRERRKTQPRGVRTFGSVFKNPQGDSAGRLLDQAGLKGVRRGGAEVSTVHANFVVNLGDATTADVLTLMMLMRQGVQRTTGILLEPEVRLLGGAFPWPADCPILQESPRADG